MFNCSCRSNCRRRRWVAVICNQSSLGGAVHNNLDSSTRQQYKWPNPGIGSSCPCRAQGSDCKVTPSESACTGPKSGRPAWYAASLLSNPCRHCPPKAASEAATNPPRLRLFARRMSRVCLTGRPPVEASSLGTETRRLAGNEGRTGSRWVLR